MLQDWLTIEGPSAYNMAWSGVPRWRRNDRGPLIQISCAANNCGFLAYEVVPIPKPPNRTFERSAARTPFSPISQADFRG